MNAFMSYKFRTKKLPLDENENDNENENKQKKILIIYKKELLSI